MLVYFDESYNDRYMLYGALFNPHSKQLHAKLTEIKDKHKYYKHDGTYKELKYTTTTTPKSLAVAKDATNAFVQSTSWFRAIVIDLQGFNYDGFGKFNEPLAIKQARAYKKFAELLIKGNTKYIQNGVLLCDGLTHCKGDLFIEKMKELFCPSPFKDIREVDSHLHEVQLMQINDILLGSILNELAASTHKQKSELKNHIKKVLKIPSLDIKYWDSMKRGKADELHPKYQVWIFKPGIAHKK
ncbi:MAG: DUF3800 domain-containing protein [Candidatus Saccharimonadales bacterium]